MTNYCPCCGKKKNDDTTLPPIGGIGITLHDRALTLWKDLFDMSVIREDVDYMVAGVGEIELAFRKATEPYEEMMRYEQRRDKFEEETER